MQGGSSKRPFSVAALVPWLCLLLALLPLFRQPGLLGAPTRWFYDDGDDDDVHDDDEDHVDDFLLRSASTCIHPVKPCKVVQQVTIIIIIIIKAVFQAKFVLVRRKPSNKLSDIPETEKPVEKSQSQSLSKQVWSYCVFISWSSFLMISWSNFYQIVDRIVDQVGREFRRDGLITSASGGVCFETGQ